MTYVDIVEGALEIRWTWLPYWLAINPTLIRELEEEIFDIAKLNGTTNSEEDLLKLHNKFCELLANRFPAFPGLAQFLQGFHAISPPAR